MNLLFYIAIFCSIISQANGIVETPIGTVLKLSWILPFLLCCSEQIKSLAHRRIQYMFVLTFLFFIFCFVAANITGTQYFGNDIYNICVSILFTITSYLYWRKKGSKRLLNNISIILIVSAIILAYSFLPLLMNSSIIGRDYAVDNKNNIAYLLLSCSVFCIINYKPKLKKACYFAFTIACLLLVYMIILKSRATILGLFLIILYIIFKSRDKKVRILSAFAALSAILIILLTPEYYEKIVDGILLAGRDASNLNDLSSNRISIFQHRLSDFSIDNCLYGIGNVYFDSFPIAIIVQYGIIGASIIFLYLKSIISHINCLNRIDNPIYLTTFLLLISLLSNSLFEAYPPFGPGTKCMVFWMCYGFCLAEEEKSNLKINNHTS